jgi:hypothetical protein
MQGQVAALREPGSGVLPGELARGLRMEIWPNLSTSLGQMRHLAKASGDPETAQAHEAEFVHLTANHDQVFAQQTDR